MSAGRRRIPTRRRTALWSVLVLVLAGLGFGAAPAAAAGAAVSFTVQSRTWVPAGTAFGVTVTARDAAGAVATSYRGTVAFTSTDPRSPVLPGRYSFTGADNGVHTFAGVVLHASGPRTISATDVSRPALTGRSAVIQVAAGPLAALAVSAPSRAVAGVGFAVTVSATDAWKNWVVSYRGTVRFSTDDTRVRSLPAAYTFTAADKGSHSFAGVTLVDTGTRTVAARDTARPGVTGSDRVVVANAQAAVDGQVLSEFDPIEGATVTVYDAVTGKALKSGKADIQGYYYLITGLPAGAVKLGATAPGPYAPDFANDRDTLAAADVFTLVPGQTLVQSWEEPFGPYLDLAYVP